VHRFVGILEGGGAPTKTLDDDDDGDRFAPDVWQGPNFPMARGLHRFENPEPNVESSERIPSRRLPCRRGARRNSSQTNHPKLCAHGVGLSAASLLSVSIGSCVRCPGGKCRHRCRTPPEFRDSRPTPSRPDSGAPYPSSCAAARSTALRHGPRPGGSLHAPGKRIDTAHSSDLAGMLSCSKIGWARSWPARIEGFFSIAEPEP